MTLDYDNDGKMDVLITSNNGRAQLFRNQAPTGNWIGFHLLGRGQNRAALGTRVWMTSADRQQMQERKSSSSYHSSGDPRLHFGWGMNSSAQEVRIRWPSGEIQVFRDLEANHYYRIEEGGRPELLEVAGGNEGDAHQVSNRLLGSRSGFSGIAPGGS